MSTLVCWLDSQLLRPVEFVYHLSEEKEKKLFQFFKSSYPFLLVVHQNKSSYQILGNTWTT